MAFFFNFWYTKPNFVTKNLFPQILFLLIKYIGRAIFREACGDKKVQLIQFRLTQASFVNFYLLIISIHTRHVI